MPWKTGFRLRRSHGAAGSGGGVGRDEAKRKEQKKGDEARRGRRALTGQRGGGPCLGFGFAEKASSRQLLPRAKPETQRGTSCERRCAGVASRMFGSVRELRSVALRGEIYMSRPLSHCSCGGFPTSDIGRGRERDTTCGLVVYAASTSLNGLSVGRMDAMNGRSRHTNHIERTSHCGQVHPRAPVRKRTRAVRGQGARRAIK